ncbi:MULTISPECIES: hypothetical protein [Streptomyces]|nr:hypothetical protein [Streptomyces sp. PpalLS-921]SCD99236.1 hypothetical protein GA0115249_111839 [Streptomyces sp. PpalLS-921]
MTVNEWLEYWLARAPKLSDEQVDEILRLMGLEQGPGGKGDDQSVS